MESQPQNPEIRNNTENFHPCMLEDDVYSHDRRQGRSYKVTS